jgi:hypothetical protein
VTTCPSCGTSNQQGQPLTFSYLPAGTPPWPTAVPARLPYAPEPVAAAPVNFAQKQPEKPGRSLRNVLLAVVVLVFVPIFGVAFTLGNLYFNGDLSPKPAAAHKVVTSQGQTQTTPTPATTQGNPLPAPSSFSTASDKDLNLSLQYPSNWQKLPIDKSNSTVTAVFQPTQKLGIILIVERYLDTTQIQSPDALNQDNISSAGSQLGATNAQPVASANTQPTISGTKWTETDVILSDSSSGSQYYFASISVLHNKSYYNIAFLVPPTKHDEAMQKYIQHMLDTMQFLS